MRFLRLFIIFSFLVLSPPIYAQLSLGAEPQQATPQAAEMTRYGSHGFNLYTGRVTVSIPIGEYRDKDFSIPVALEYNYNGMRPNEQAAEPGLGWMLSCGGMITREVVGQADEGEGAMSQRSFNYYTPTGEVASKDLLPFDRIPFDSLATYGSIVGQLLTSADRPSNALTVAYEVNGRLYDASADIYHFRMPGHSGNFYRNDDGSFTVYDTGGAGGTYRIEKTNGPATGTGYRSQIVITTGDGYRYVFGSLTDDDEYLDRRWLSKEPGSDRGTIVAWRLRSIVSPGGREAQFTYHYKNADHNRAVQGFAAERWRFSSDDIIDQNLYGEAVYTTYAPLEKVTVDEEVIRFHYSEKDSLLAGRYLHTNGPRPLKRTEATYLLDSIRCNGVTTWLTYAWNSSGNPYPFLSEVHTEGVGSWQMAYEGLTSGYFPMFGTVATDHWGYLNQTGQSQCDTSIIHWPAVDTLYPNYTELEVPNSLKHVDTTAVRLGLMSSIRYPTGGSTHFTYAANRYGKIVDKRYGNSFYPQDITESGEGPGVRVTRIENQDSDGTVTDARDFSYGEGRLLSPFRHLMKYEGTLYDLYSPGYTYTTLTVCYATAGGILRPGSVLLEYPAVTETRLDGSRTVRTFTSWTDRADTMTNSYTPMMRISTEIWVIIGYVQGISNIGDVHRILEPRSSLQHFRGLPLTTEEYAAGSSSPVQTESYSYDLSEPSYRTEFINVGEAYARVRRYAGEARAHTRTTTSRYFPYTVSSVVNYTYNDKGQVVDERTEASDGDSLRTVRTWPQDYPQDAVLSAMASANFVDYPVTEVRLRRRSGSAGWDTTAATRYNYAAYTNVQNKTFYAVSSVQQRQDDGTWVTGDTYLHDAEGNVIQSTDADGIVTSYVWNSFYGVSIVVENASRSQVTACLAQSPVVDITNTAAAAARLRSGLPQARVSDFEYRRVGLPTRMTDPAGHTLRYFYDDNDRLVTVREDNAGILQQYQYNTVTR